MGTLHCALENGVNLYVNSVRRYDTISLGLLKKEEEEEDHKFLLRAVCTCVRKLAL